MHGPDYLIARPAGAGTGNEESGIVVAKAGIGTDGRRRWLDPSRARIAGHISTTSSSGSSSSAAICSGSRGARSEYSKVQASVKV